MDFKIVQTIEDGNLCLAIVPGTWEENGSLWWPNQKANLGSLLKNPNSFPDKSKWEKIPCIKKRLCSSFKEAEKELQFMEQHSDTETEDVKRDVSRKRVKKQSAVQVEIPSFNDEISRILNNNMINHEAERIESGKTQYVNLKSQLTEEDHIVIPVETTDFLTSTQLEQIDGVLEPTGQIETINNNEVLNKLNVVIENQEKIMFNIGKLQNQVDALGRIIGKTNITDNIKTRETHNVVLAKPVSSLEELELLENKLKDEDYMSQIVDNMSFICGSTGKQNGLDCCYKLIDYFLDRKFVTSCSWTGNTRAGQGVTKVPLKFFDRFRACFLKLIIKADIAFGERDCDAFFKRILKNSQQRQSAKGNIESKHKSRPKNLLYKKSLQKSKSLEQIQDENKENCCVVVNMENIEHSSDTGDNESN